MDATVRRFALSLASFFLPGLGHIIRGHMLIGILWMAVWFFIFPHIILCLLAAIHCYADS